MAKITRRRFLQVSGMSVAALGAGQVPVFGQARRRVLVIGGGWGGATAAKYLRLTDPSIDVTLLEPNKEFISCPFSNLVLA
ncbi:MAG TPA: twin-arginine translocation signal domain-containing protein, partial [Candidatus Deferrimicrobium sp.]|nr:twin-arginine translocation signal domain-containing protein [Candidatus Deferrimicrobium sp.]